MKYLTLALLILTIGLGIMAMLSYSASSELWLIYGFLSLLSLSISMFFYQMVITEEMDEGFGLRK